MEKLIDVDVINESYIVLEKLELLHKLPENVLSFLKSNLDENYSYTIDSDIPLDLQIKNENTKAYISYLFLKYINDSKEEKQLLLNMYKQNQEKEDEFIREKYNPDNIFKKNENNINEKDEIKEDKLMIVEEKKSIIKVFISLLKKIFRK